MEKDLKILLGKILGETYRIQKKLDICNVSDGEIYGLLNGFEIILDKKISDYQITTEQYDSAVKVLNEIFYDKEKLKNFDGYYSIEQKMESVGIGRNEAITLFNYFNAIGSFKELIEKLDSRNSPNELRKFDEEI